MMNHSLTNIEPQLQQITNMLLLNGTLVECPGLIHGKTGIAIFFFQYARHTGNELFDDYAFDLIGEIQTQIHNNSPADYETGIAGIGTGIDYMVRNKFLEADDHIFDDFDQRMYRAVMYDPWQDFSMYDGLTGYGRYWMMRMQYQPSSVQARKCLLHIVGLIEERFSDISTNEQNDVYCFLQDLHKISGFDICIGLLEQCQKWDLQSADISQYFPRLSNSFVCNIVRMYQHHYYFNGNLQDEIHAALQQIPNLDIEKSPANMGLLTGYAGEGILRLTALNQTNISWMNLL